MSLRFCGCTLDVDARQLFRGQDEVHLSPKAFETLRALVENRPRAMSKKELLARVWPDVIVSEVNVARVVSELRAALDDGLHRIIRTVHSHGYAFAAELEHTVSHHAGPAGRHSGCWLISSTYTLALYEGEQIIGRDPALELCLASPKVSRRHARIAIKGKQATIEDLGSKNGSFVKDVRIAAPTALHHGDEVRIGRFTFVFRLHEPSASTETDS